jgi:predicted DNA-binding transcriptional regulator YafY
MIAFQQALLTRRQIEGDYQSPHEKGTKRVKLQPRRVFLIAHTWYAVCDDQTGKTKLYRLARFKSAKLTTKPLTVSSEFSLREFLGNAWCVYRGDRDWYVEAKFTPEAAPLVAEGTWHHTQELIPQPDGSLIFHATVTGLEEIKYWILQWGPRVKVLKPRELAQEVRQLAQNIVSLYEG